MERPRVGGRLSSRAELGKLGIASQERTERTEARASSNSPSKHRVKLEHSSTIGKDVTTSFDGIGELEDLHKGFATRRS